MVAIAFAAWLIFFTFNSTEFGNWLEYKGATIVYSSALAKFALVYSVACAWLIWDSTLASEALSRFSTILVITYGSVNIMTLGILVLILIQLQAEFNLEYKKLAGR